MSEPVAPPTKALILAADPRRVFDLITNWPTAARHLTDHGDSYEGAVRAPEWGGRSATAVVTTAGRHNSAIQDAGAKITLLTSTANGAMAPVANLWRQLHDLIVDLDTGNPFTVGEDLAVQASDLDQQTAAEQHQVQLRRRTEEWWNAETSAAEQIRNGARELSPAGSGVFPVNESALF